MTNTQDSNNGSEKLAVGNAENLYSAICIYLGMPADKSAESVIGSAMGALEYAAVIAKTSGITRETFDETVENAWRAAHGEKPSVIQVAKNMPKA